MNLPIEVADKLSPALQRIASALDGPDRITASEAMGAEVRSLIVTHLRELGNSRHTTAERLGATPTGYISQLAENFDQSSTVAVDEDGVSITMRHPILVRAVRDVTILPKKQFLTIPMNALAYGRRVGEFEKFILLKQGGHREDNQEEKPKEDLPQDIPVWMLVRSVTQKRDPSLLPTFEEITAAAALGVKKTVKAVLAEAQKL